MAVLTQALLFWYQLEYRIDTSSRLSFMGLPEPNHNFHRWLFSLTQSKFLSPGVEKTTGSWPRTRYSNPFGTGLIGFVGARQRESRRKEMEQRKDIERRTGRDRRTIRTPEYNGLERRKKRYRRSGSDRRRGWPPTCTFCGKICGVSRLWTQGFSTVESTVESSISICPDCSKKRFPQFYSDD